MSEQILISGDNSHLTSRFYKVELGPTQILIWYQSLSKTRCATYYQVFVIGPLRPHCRCLVLGVRGTCLVSHIESEMVFDRLWYHFKIWVELATVLTEPAYKLRLPTTYKHIFKPYLMKCETSNKSNNLTSNICSTLVPLLALNSIVICFLIYSYVCVVIAGV